MELKAKQEYTTEKERLDFIVEYNHKQGYEIRYSEETEETTGTKTVPEYDIVTETVERPLVDEETGRAVLDNAGEQVFEEVEVSKQVQVGEHEEEYSETVVHNFIEAWGNDNEELLAQLKEVKLAEALEKAYEYENKTGFVTFDGRPVFDTQPDETIKLSVELFNQGKFFQLVIGFAEGLLKHDFVYSTKEDVVVYINEQEAQGIYYAITQALSDLWTEKYPMYKAHIENAQTREELNGIVIDYSKNIEVEDVEEVTTESEGVDNEL